MERTLADLAELYSDSLAAHGPTPMGVGWRSEQSQALRFSRLGLLLPPVGTPFSVNDLGCGYGALHDALAAQGHEFAYTGYDISEEMLGACRTRLPTSARLVLSSTPTHTADFSFASGLFNVRLDEPEPAWEAYIEDCLHGLAEASSSGFAFNLLTTSVDYHQDTLYYGDPVRWFEWCRSNITPSVALLHDYPLYEWTILCRFGEAPKRA